MDNCSARECLEHGDHIAVADVNSVEALMSSMKEKMEAISPSLCIHSVPENLRKGSEASFTPEVISIGPLHFRKESLKAVEKLKWRYLRALLGRKPNMEASLEDCVKAMRQIEQRARKCYDCPISMSSNEFVEMMVVDGCFIIELFLNHTMKGLRRRGDYIFSNNWMLFSVRSDMILLENQLPFFILQRLFELVPVPKQCDQSLFQLAFRFFRILIPGDTEVMQNKFSQDGDHLVDLIRNCYLPSFPAARVKQNEAQGNINPAEKLKVSGVKFKKANATDSDGLLDISFVNGVFEILPLRMHNYTETLLRNLIALEHCSKDTSKIITSYVFFMSGLVQSTKDVQLLHERGVMRNCLGANDDAIPVLFKKLSNKVVLENFYYAELCGQVNSYSRTKLCHCFCLGF